MQYSNKHLLTSLFKFQHRYDQNYLQELLVIEVFELFDQKELCRQFFL